MSMLTVKDLCVSYGAINAVRNVCFDIRQGEIVTLIGANGAGKSTIMRTITGLVKAKSGSIQFEGEDILGIPSHAIVQKGISLSPEGRQIFPRLSVRDNLEMGAYLNSRADVERGMAQAFALFPILKERLSQMGGTLSGGEQQMLAVARALMSNPRLLILDEPSLGLAPMVVRDLFDLFLRINQNGVTILLVEQNAKMALSVSNRGYVLEVGRVALSGTGENLLHDPSVQAAYLGGV